MADLELERKVARLVGDIALVRPDLFDQHGSERVTAAARDIVRQLERPAIPAAFVRAFEVPALASGHWVRHGRGRWHRIGMVTPNRWEPRAGGYSACSRFMDADAVTVADAPAAGRCRHCEARGGAG